jgi:hypothetical protein
MAGSPLKAFAKKLLGPRNCLRWWMLRDFLGRIRGTFAPDFSPPPPTGYPIPVEDLRRALVEMGIGPGSVILVHSSLPHLYGGAKIGRAHV